MARINPEKINDSRITFSYLIKSTKRKKRKGRIAKFIE
jgi:hypothetical protein